MSRLIPLPIHSALEIVLGTAIIAAPLVLGLGTAALVTGFAVGVLVIGLAVGATGSGRGAIPVSAHAAYDGGIGVGLIAAGVVLGVAGDLGALAVLGTAGVFLLLLNATTRYSLPAGA